MKTSVLSLDQSLPWRWPVDGARYDRTPELRATEQSELEHLFSAEHHPITQAIKVALQRLVQPIEEVLTVLHADANIRSEAIRILFREMHRWHLAFWGWSAEAWIETIGENPSAFARRHGRSVQAGSIDQARRCLALLSYLFHLPPGLDVWLQQFQIYGFARNVFGEALIHQTSAPLQAILRDWGYQEEQGWHFQACICYLLLWTRSPNLASLTSEQLESIEQTCTNPSVQRALFRVSRALWALGYIARPLRGMGESTASSGTDGSLSAEWLTWCQRWRQQSTMKQRDSYFYTLLKVGRWLLVHHPEVKSPADMTYEVAAELVGAVNTMTIGEWSDAQQRTRMPAAQVGQPLRATSKNRLLGVMRTFLRDCQEWGWIPVRLNPHRTLRTPRAISNLMGPDPRVIEKDRWAKLLWAAMNLEAKDLLSPHTEKTWYPCELVRALAMVWCFAALRSDEIARLRVGCVRWQQDDVLVPETGEWLPKEATCFLDVPVNKTSTAYTKPVHPLVGKRINEWEAVRPREQPRATDQKTGELVQFLFSYRGRRVSHLYINHFLIPLLCRKAGVPEEDSRGPITSHRARATIASMLYNAKEPLSVLELKEYLGHKHLSSTQYYLKVDPTKLASRVAKAGYLEQNLATVEVLLDQEAVLSGAAARGEVWKYYDLGHGYCTNTFWAECHHRMACARCPFYRPKNSTMDQLVEGRANLVHMLEFVRLTEEEQQLVSEGIELHQELIDKLADVPTPAGPTPRELGMSQQGVTLIPLEKVRSPKQRNQAKQD